MKPIIGIVGYIDKLENETYVVIGEDYRKSILLSGGIPMLILPTQRFKYDYDIKPSEIDRLSIEEKKDLEQQIDMCDGIIIPGGKQWYEHHEYIFNYANKNNKSILGICLGMQLMAAVPTRNTDIVYKNIKNETTINHRSKPSSEYCHEVILNKDTKLYQILKEEKFKVNSRHNYHIGNTKNFIISAVSTDGLPEAIELPEKNFVIGIQWHPEALIDNDSISKKIFNSFVDSCKKDL